MAFNFNWSPLIADTSRARDMLTTALNKSPKPPIIVDDIIVTELNLGSVPPELEILEIGDLAEDRFRGIFKMQYTGDAFLTLKTRVQANPLNTYLSTKPTFASPQPLAASSGLTIPLQITLSDIRLSGFVILVFSKQKGITLVFRNDPLESLKVSSTFDSIPFVRNYLQKEIEGQLRVLFMEDLPAIIHRLSLRLFSTEHQETEADLNSNRVEGTDAEPAIDPLATPSQRPYDTGSPAPANADLPFISLDTGVEAYYSFSTKNLLRLAALTDSHRTLSLFTPPIRDVMFRAWAGAAERGEHTSKGLGTARTFSLASLSRQNSMAGSVSSIYSEVSSDAGMTTASAPTRPALASSGSSYSGPMSTMAMSIGTGFGRSRPHAARKRKNRIVDLRKKKQQEEDATTPTGHAAQQTIIESTSRTPTPTSSSAPSSRSQAHAGSAYGFNMDDDDDDELVTAPPSPDKRNVVHDDPDATIHAPRARRLPSARDAHEAMLAHLHDQVEASPPRRVSRTHSAGAGALPTTRRTADGARTRQHAPPLQHSHSSYSPSDPPAEHSPSSATSPYLGGPPGGILEQAWMMKMAAEMAQKVESQKQGQQSSRDRVGFWSSSDSGHGEGEIPPPYAA